MRSTVLSTLVLIVAANAIVGCRDSTEVNMAANMQSSNRNSGYRGSVVAWRSFLTCWQREIGVEQRVGGKHVNISALESRLNTQLPNSYRHFIEASEGDFSWWNHKRFSDQHFGVLPVEHVNWFRLTNKSDVSIWTKHKISVPDPDYLKYDAGQDYARIRTDYVPGLLSIGEEPGGHFYTLNPAMRTADGEWEAWLLGPRLPGAIRFPSFAELMVFLYLDDVRKESSSRWRGFSEAGGSCAEPLFVGR